MLSNIFQQFAPVCTYIWTSFEHNSSDSYHVFFGGWGVTLQYQLAGPDVYA